MGGNAFHALAAGGALEIFVESGRMCQNFKIFIRYIEKHCPYCGKMVYFGRKKDMEHARKNYLSLQNGSDIRGVALGIDGHEVTLTTAAATAIGAAFARILRETLKKQHVTVAVGQDSRLSADTLSRAIADGIGSEGGNVLLCGLSTTPSMYDFLKENADADASVMVTASHLPRDRNGFKFFTREGGLESDEVRAILALAETVSVTLKPYACERRPYLAKYAAKLVSYVRGATGQERPLRGLRILVDAGNGAGGFYASEVLAPLGADTAGSQFLEPDGNFPNHIPNPENADAMRSLTQAVERCHADFGVIFDTDVDRAGAVGKGGTEFCRNRLIALISAILLRERAGAYIVTDSVTSTGLGEFIAEHGGIHHRYKRGYKNVIDEAKRLNAEGKYAPLAIETSGHAALMENNFLDDGAYLVTRLLVAMAKEQQAGRSLDRLLDGLKEPAEAVEVRLPITLSDYRVAGMGILDSFEAYIEALPYAAVDRDNREGVRVNFDTEHGCGWLLIRRSLHEAVLPVNAESERAGGTKKMLRELLIFLRKQHGVDLGPLEQSTR